MASRLHNEIAKAVRAYAYRKQLADTLPQLESMLHACFDYLKAETLTGYRWQVRRENGTLVYEPLPGTDQRQLYLPTFEHLAKALEEEKGKKGKCVSFWDTA